MEWKHKGITYTITIKPMGALVMASARAPEDGMFVRVRPYSAIGTDEEQAKELLKKQIRMENESVPIQDSSSSQLPNL
jgi:hypothetical protein